MAPVLEFAGGQRAPFPIDRSELVIGRGAACALRVDGAAAEQHARLTLDGSGRVYVQDLDTQTGTLRNGNFVYGLQPLDDGDRLELGGVTLVFRLQATAPIVVPEARAGADDRTRMPTELPPEVRAALAARDRAAALAPTEAALAPTPAAPSVAAGVVVGRVEPEPANFRTVQMSAPDLAALGIDSATLPPVATPRPAVSPAAATPPPVVPSAPLAPRPSTSAKRTMLGMPAVQLPVPVPPSPPPSIPAREEWAPPPSASPPPPAVAQAATMMAEATQLPVAPKPAPRTAQLDAQPAPRTAQLDAQPAPRTAQLDAQPAPLGTQPTMMAQAPALAVGALPNSAPLGTQPTMMAQAPALAVGALPNSAPLGTQPTMMAQAPALAVGALPPAAAPGHAAAPWPAAPSQQPYSPPAKGAFGSFSRALAFMTQLLTLARAHKALLRPLVWDVLLTTPVMAAFTVLLFFVHSRNGFYACLAVEGFLLYFIDYACNSITCSLMYDYATTGAATLDSAVPRVRRALSGIVTFAAVSALLDLLSTYARERNDFAARILLRVLRAIWTTATYVIMPALVIEGVSFGDAFKRSRALMDHDPTGVGAGVVAMSITSYLIAAVCFPLAWVVMRTLGYVHPAIGALGGMLIVNLYWAVSGWMKIAYSTCFYMWARECERTGSTDHALAPLPLRAALDAA